MKIKSMNIKGHRYRFKTLPLRESYGVLGKCDSSSKIIYIDDKLEGEDLTATILHEIGHAITNSLDTSRSYQNSLISRSPIKFLALYDKMSYDKSKDRRKHGDRKNHQKAH